MRKQLKTVIIAVVLFGLLLGAYFFAQYVNRANEPEEAAEPEPTENLRLLERPKEDLLSVTFSSDFEEMVFLPKIDERYNRVEWYIEGYEDLSLETSTMDSMVTPVYYFSPIEKLDPTDDNLAEFGIDKPSVTVTGKYKDGSEEIVYIGKIAPSGDYYYAKLDGTPGVYLLYSITGDRFFNTANDLVKKDIPGVYIDSLLYAYFYQKDTYELEVGYTGSDDEMKKDLESYGMVSLSILKPYPGRDLYYSNLSTNLLEHLESLSFKEVADTFPEDLSVYGLDDPEIIIHLIDSEEDVYHMMIGADTEDGEYSYAMLADRPVVYTISKSMLEPFYDVNILKMVDKFVALVNIVNCDEIFIDSKDRGRSHHIALNHEIVKAETEDDRDEEFIYPEIDGKFYEEQPFKIYYQTLIGLMYDVEIFDYEIPGEPLFTVRYVMNDGKPDVWTRYYEYNNDFYAVKRDDNPVQFVVNKRSVVTMFDTLDKLFRGELKK